MNTPLNNDTQAKARELARKITVAHDLDPEIQEELYGHIEDKLLAYKSGEERVSDEDAFILVREHFGDAKVLAALFASVHKEPAVQGQGVEESERANLSLDHKLLNGRRRAALVLSCFLIGGAGWIQEYDVLTPDILVARLFALVLLGSILFIHFVSIPREIKRGSVQRAGALASTTVLLLGPAAFLSVYALVPGPIAGDSRKILAVTMFAFSMAVSGALAWVSWRRGDGNIQKNDIVQR